MSLPTVHLSLGNKKAVFNPPEARTYRKNNIRDRKKEKQMSLSVGFTKLEYVTELSGKFIFYFYFWGRVSVCRPGGSSM